MRFRSAILTCILTCAATATPAAAQTPRTDSLDAYVREQMSRRHIPGLSLAIVEGGRVVYAKGYGVADVATGKPVTTSTLFQAGSISKPVSALGALHLVEAGKLSLDAPINTYLTSWRVPENAFTATEKVTLRRLLSHSAGVTVHGFPGYAVTERMPSLEEVLDGKGNTAAIRVDTTPGAIWRYSGGGFTIMQQAMIDAGREPFPAFMQRTVLAPIGMTASSFEQPQPAARAERTASGYYGNRSPVPGRWHVYPEMAAAGLWTTPTDLARFAMEIQETLAGRGHHVISPAMARQYVTEQKGGSGLGIGVNGSGPALRFSHGGRDEGFDATLVGFAGTGQAVAIMINANDNSAFMERLTRFIGRSYGWPDAPATGPPAGPSPIAMEASALARFGGMYEIRENQMQTIAPAAGAAVLQTLSDGFPDVDLLPVDSVTFVAVGQPLRVSFVRDGKDEVTAMEWQAGGRTGRAPRVAPLPSTVTPSADPDTALTARIDAALHAVVAGGATIQGAPGLAPGAKKDFAGGTPDLAGVKLLGYVGESDVSGRGIRRHGADVARVRFYRVTTDAGPSFLLVHLTADGLVTDYDLVGR